MTLIRASFIISLSGAPSLSCVDIPHTEGGLPQIGNSRFVDPDEDSAGRVSCRMEPCPAQVALIAALSELGQTLDLGPQGIRLIPYEMHYPVAYFFEDGSITINLSAVYPEEAMRMLGRIATRLGTTLIWPGEAEPPGRGRPRPESPHPQSLPTHESDM